MAFRSDDPDFRWPRPREGSTRRDAADELSLHATLRELAVTIAGFVGVILLIIAMVSAFNA